MFKRAEMNTYEVEITCHSCGKKEKVKIKSLIDTALDPSAETNLLRGKLFRHSCSKCHTEQNMLYTCMYHDGSKNLLIGYPDNQKDYEEMNLMFNRRYHRDELDEALNKWIETCTKRIVSNQSDMQEKALIALLGLDDRIIEIGKYVTGDLAKIQSQSLEIDHMYFNTSGDEYAFLIQSGDGIVGEVPFTKELYQTLEEHYKPYLAEDESVEIDSNWVSDFLRKVKDKQSQSN